MKNSEIKILSDFLEAMLDKPVINETGITGNYDLELPWYHEKPDNIYKEPEKIGLELKDEVRPVEVLVIRDK